jgi:Rhs family protein
VVKYLYDGLTPVIERDSAGTTLAVYTRIPDAPGGIGGLISSKNGANTYYYHDSHLGNVNQITNSTGVIVQTYDYDTFGNVASQTGSLTQAYKYKTKEASEDTGLIFFGARYYNLLIGRFITPDPLGMVDGPNLYAYCNSDPIDLVDPWGLEAGGIIFPGPTPIPGGTLWGDSGIPWDDINRRQEYQRSLNKCGGGSYFSNKGKDGTFKGGKKNKRDRDWGIKNKKFWDWWHELKQKYGYQDIDNSNDARYWYDQWGQGGY